MIIYASIDNSQQGLPIWIINEAILYLELFNIQMVLRWWSLDGPGREDVSEATQWRWTNGGSTIELYGKWSNKRSKHSNRPGNPVVVVVVTCCCCWLWMFHISFREVTSSLHLHLDQPLNPLCPPSCWHLRHRFQHGHCQWPSIDGSHCSDTAVIRYNARAYLLRKHHLQIHPWWKFLTWQKNENTCFS